MNLKTYFISDKKVMQAVVGFPLVPVGYVEKLSGILGRAGDTPAELGVSVDSLETLWRQVIALCPDEYRSRFKLSF